jgi:hypothetical protein
MWVCGEQGRVAPILENRHLHIYLRRVEVGLLTAEREVSLLEDSILECEGMPLD